MKKIVVTLVIAGILYCFYSAGMAGHSYITISNLLDEVVPRQIGTTGVSDQYQAQERNERIKSAVAQTVTDAGIPIDRTNVSISEDRGKLAVRVEHQHPFVTFQGETKAAIPVAVTSTYLLPPPRN